MARFQRIYWSKDFNWKEYARLYNDYCQRQGNYYQQSARALIHSLRLPQKARVIDTGAGTGALTRELLRIRPDVTVIAIDLSSDMLKYYRQQFSREIRQGRILVIAGNAEQLHKYVKNRVDAIFISCAIWDMEISPFLRNAKQILKPQGKIVFNLPALVTGISRGFIWFIEQSVREVLPGEELYRRIPRGLLLTAFAKQGFSLETEQRYRFKLSKEDVNEFFKVLRYRYPFILFPRDMPYEERLQLCTRIFKSAVKRLTEKGVIEEGAVFVLRL
jgi:precorrin-6B methylase 2